MFSQILYSRGITKDRHLINTTQQQRAYVWKVLASHSPVLVAWEKWDPFMKYSGYQVLASCTSENTLQELTKILDEKAPSGLSNISVNALRLADFLLIKDCVIINDALECQQRQSLNELNYLKILLVCSLTNIDHFLMDTFIRANLITLSKSSDILAICLDSVEFLLTDEQLSYWPMDDRYCFITNWCNAGADRALLFERLFDHLDLNMIDKDIIRVMIKTDALVQKSKTYLYKVIHHLRDRQEQPVPYIFILNKTGNLSNIIGFNLEDGNPYKFNFEFLQRISSNTHKTMLTDSGRIISIGKLDGCLYDYDISTNVLKKRVFLYQQHRKYISHIFEANGRLILIFNTAEKGSTVHQQVSESSTTLEVEPVVSFPFQVGGACYLDPVIIVSSKLHGQRSNLFLLNLKERSLTKMDLSNESLVTVIYPYIQFLFPVGDQIFLCDMNVGVLLTLDANSNTYSVNSSISVSVEDPKYMVISDFIVEISQRSIRWCDARNGDISVDNWKSVDLEKLNFEHSAIGLHSYIQRTIPRCHWQCPHCEEKK